MTSHVFYQVDAFAGRPFEGNPACVMLLPEGFADDATLQAIAAENNVSETAYLVPEGEGAWQLRWFTPATEVPLCGHATLAAAHVLFAHEGFAGAVVRFRTRQSGELFVRRRGAAYEMDFPAADVFDTQADADIAAALGAQPVHAWGGPFFAAQFETAEDVAALAPDFRALRALGVSGQGGTWARGNFGCFALGGDGVDVTSRFFAPGSGIDEDPATGSWHCMLGVIARDLTGQAAHDCFQAYPGRGARIGVHLEGDRVKLTGNAVTVIEGRFAF